MTKPVLPNFSDGISIDGVADGGMVLRNVGGEQPETRKSHRERGEATKAIAKLPDTNTFP